MRYGLFSPRPPSNVCVSNEYDENMWIMTPMFCLLCYDSGLVMAMAVLWSGPWLAAATSPGQWFRGGRKKSGSDDSKQLNRPGSAPHLLPLSPSFSLACARTQPLLWKFQQFKLISNRLHNYQQAEEEPSFLSPIRPLPIPCH